MTEVEIEALEMEMQQIVTADLADTEVEAETDLDGLEAEMAAILGR